MNKNRGIFESFPDQPVPSKDAPFPVVPESPVAASPFTAVTAGASPFTIAAVAQEPSAAGMAKIPERLKAEIPFQMAEPLENFGFEAPAKVEAAVFMVPPQRQAAVPVLSATPTMQVAAPVRETVGVTAKLGATPAVVAAPIGLPEVVSEVFGPDSSSIRQLELRAIFGVDRELTREEIFQRSCALPGMRHLAEVSAADRATIDALKNLLPDLGFGSGGLRLYAGTVPLEFIREGPVMLAVHTDGGFAPGVRETLMLVARELGRMG